eukprot:11717485-Ditylum_brightwellii.AAC.1
MSMEEEHFSFEWDEEKLYLKVSKPDDGNLTKLEVFLLNSPMQDMTQESNNTGRKKKVRSPTDILMEKWRKRFAILP